MESEAQRTAKSHPIAVLRNAVVASSFEKIGKVVESFGEVLLDLLDGTSSF